ncbi:MAG: alpha-amylase [Bacteroidales bacterium]|nr:alpha-amylase [Bacteroidales bacterium]
MKRILSVIVAVALAACSGKPAFDPATVADATQEQVTRVEPLSWWVGMKTDLQLLIQGTGISDYDVTIEGGKGVSVGKVTKAESPNYLFVDVNIAPDAEPGTYYIVFSKDGQSFKYPYEIAAREEGSAERKSFTTADMVYLIMPDRFANGDPSNDSTEDTAEKADRADGNGRHGGDIQGVIDHLDYISDLGATYIWTTPFLEDNAPDGSYHGYAASDYYHIDSRFGSNELYRTLVDKAREKGIGIIMDIVPNHCGTEHWWMNDLPFQDWIHQFPEYTGTNVAFSTNMDPNASQKDLYIQESGWFVPSMVDMNLDNPYVLQYFIQWGVWWIEYSGLNGFRVDTYPYNEKVPASEWCKAIMNEYPDFNIVGECWTSSIPQLAYWQGGNENKDGFDSNLPSIMDFPLHDAMRAALAEDEGGWGAGMTKVYDILSHDFVYHDLSKMLIFPGNHDTARIGDVVRKDPRALKIAMAMMATMRGIPQIFAGDELMFVSSKPDNIGDHPGLRVDFPGGWEGDEIDLFTAEGRKAQTHNTDGLKVEKGQAADLFDYVSGLFQWRKTKDVIHNGKTMHFMTRDNTYAYFRYDEDDVVFVYINNTLEDKNVPWSYYSEISEGLTGGVNVITGEPFEVSDATVVAPKSVLIVEYSRLYR